MDADRTRNPRRAARVQQVLESTLVALMREKGYEAVTVGEICKQAEVGRTTFYRYYQSKADVLVSLHTRRFEQLQLAPQSKAAWLADDPPASLVQLCESVKAQGRSRPMLYLLGQDVTLIHRLIRQALEAHFQRSISNAFPAEKALIPIPVLSHSLAGAFIGLFQHWMQEASAFTPTQMAGYVHRLLRAELYAAFPVEVLRLHEY